MIAGFLKSNQPATLFFIPLLALLMWIPALFYPETQDQPFSMYFYNGIVFLLNKIPLWGKPLVCIILISFNALYLNAMVNAYDLLPKQSYLPAFFMVFLNSLSPEFLAPNPVLFALTPILIAFRKLFKMYKNEKTTGSALEAGFWVAFATLIYFPSISFLVLYYAGIIILRPFVWREWVVPLIGFGLVFYFLGIVLFLTGGLNDFIQNNAYYFSPSNRNQPTSWFSTKQLAVFIGILLLLLLSLRKMMGQLNKMVIRSRNFLQVFFVFLILMGLPPLFTPYLVSNYYFLFFSIPFSIFLCFYFATVKSRFFTELVMTAMLAGWTYLHFS